MFALLTCRRNNFRHRHKKTSRSNLARAPLGSWRHRAPAKATHAHRHQYDAQAAQAKSNRDRMQRHTHEERDAGDVMRGKHGRSGTRSRHRRAAAKAAPSGRHCRQQFPHVLRNMKRMHHQRSAVESYKVAPTTCRRIIKPVTVTKNNNLPQPRWQLEGTQPRRRRRTASIADIP